MGSYPSYFLRLREVNRRGPAVYGPQLPDLALLSPAELHAAVTAGAELVDVRAIAHFAAGHIPGALSIALRPAFASWLGWTVEADRDLVFVVDADQDREDLVRQCLKIGYERLAGELAGGMAAWRAAGLAERRLELTARRSGSDGHGRRRAPGQRVRGRACARHDAPRAWQPG